MPEGHALHRLARRQRQQFGGQRLAVSSPQGRFGPEAALLDGLVFADAQAWGKHLVYWFGDGRQSPRLLHIHLGIYGAFTEEALPMPEPIGKVRLRMVGERLGVDLRGPNACELYTPADLEMLLGRLGPDPLRPDADEVVAGERIRRSRRAIGSLLMDQRVIAGIGNIYRAEVLFRAGIDPMRPGTSISRTDFGRIWADLLELMPLGVETGLIHVVRPDDDHGAPAYAPNRPRTYVYRRAGEPCRSCGTPIAVRVLEGRNLFWCPACQS